MVIIVVASNAGAKLVAWLTSTKPDFLYGTLLGLVLSPVTVFVTTLVTRAIDRRNVRLVLYDDIAISYAAVALALQEIGRVWEAKAKAIVDTDALLALVLPDLQKETDEQRRERKLRDAELLKGKVLPAVVNTLRSISLERYETLSKSKMLILYELAEYRTIIRIFRVLGDLQAGAIDTEVLFEYLGWFRVSFRKLNSRFLRRALHRQLEGSSLTVALDALRSDASVAPEFLEASLEIMYKRGAA
jgi:hypothetical protein